MPKYVVALQYDPSFKEVAVTAIDAVDACERAVRSLGDAEDIRVLELHQVQDFDVPFYNGTLVAVPEKFRCS